MPLHLLRLIDANLNRSSEGLRVLEDVARFLLNDAGLSQQLKTIRHDLASSAKSLDIRLLSQRNSEYDVGAHGEKIITGETAGIRRDITSIVTGNAKRVEESLRVLEELAKLPEIRTVLDSARFEQTRFTLYTLERDLASRVLRRDKTERLTGLYVILDRQILTGKDELDIARQIIHGGARIIQLRDKQSDKAELLPVARKLRDLCSKEDVLFIINDYLDLAMAVDADGLHIGQGDLPLPIVRNQLPVDKIIGCSINTVSQAIEAQDNGVDYIAAGSIFPTATKKGVTVVGVDMIKELKQKVVPPLVAIGGINRSNIAEVVAAGADSIAIISAILEEKDIKEAVQQLIAKMELAKERCRNQ